VSGADAQNLRPRLAARLCGTSSGVVRVPNAPAHLRIGLDARCIFAPQPRGTGRNLCDAYRLLPTLRPDWEFVLYHQNPAPRADDATAALTAPPNVRARCIDLPGDRFGWWLHARLPLAAWRDGVDLLHLPANAVPTWCPVPYVATIHDLAPLRVPGEYTPAQTRRFRQQVRRAARHAAHLIVPSAATRDELYEEFHVSPARVTVVPWAPDETSAASVRTPAAREAAIARVRSAYALPSTWMLNFSGPSRRKNAGGLIAALAQLPESVRSHVCVVLVGCEPAAFRAELLAQAERLHVAGQVRLLGFVPHVDLSGLIAGARAVLLPSLCEGFGLPILDAFACGVPVLTSALSSMPEVAGAAAVYCEPRSPSSIAEGLRALLDDEVAARLARAGSERVRRFTWLRTARLMCGVYARCLAGARERAARRALAPTEARA
jgi:glycosyltransferase involved in cell wall biosynthesis